jgi:hypothetical protein
METEKRTIEMYDPQGTYNEGGRGRKKCNCGKFVGVRVKECPICKFKFQAKIVEKSLPVDHVNFDVKTEKVGKGQKQCPKCLSIIGSRCHICTSCNYMFSAKEEKEEIRVINGKGFRSVYTPSQYQLGGVASFCPVKLYGTTFEQVGEWIEKVLVSGEKEQLLYTPPALKYFLRHSFEMYSKEWKEAVVVLNELSSINSEKKEEIK